MPLNVSTLISADLSVASLRIAALTLVVMTVSSTYSPVPSCLAVDAQPSAIVTNRMPANVANLRVMLVTLLPSNELLRHHGAELQASHEEQDDHDQQHDADDPAGTVAPAARMRPRGNDADEYEDQDNQQDGAYAHGSCSFSCASSSFRGDRRNLRNLSKRIVAAVRGVCALPDKHRAAGHVI